MPPISSIDIDLNGELRITMEEYRGDSEVEADSDHEDGEWGGGGGGGDGTWLGHPLHNYHADLDSYETGTVRRRVKTIVTPKMAMESFRLSFLNDDQDVNFDAILGELYELESQLNTTQTELSRSLGSSSSSVPPPPPAGFQDPDGENGGSSETLHMAEQEELDALAAEITQGLHYPKSNGHPHPQHPHHHHQHPHHHHQQHQHHHHPHHPHHHHVTLGMMGLPAGRDSTGSSSWGCSDSACGDGGETDSAYSDNASLPSSESYTSMATVSSSADTTSSSSGETCSMSSGMAMVNHTEEEQNARMKAEKILIALEKIKEAKIRKLFVRAFAQDGSSKSILVDEKMTVSQVCSQLADKNHSKLNHCLCVVEHMPELLMERILEDHDSLVESMVMWTRDSKNKIMFQERIDKYDLFRNPEKYLLSPTTTRSGPLSPQQKDKLIQEFFGTNSACVPPMEGALYLKSDGKKAWKKFFFVLRASGLYYNPKGKASKNPRDLVCLVQFEFVEVYQGLGWKKKYHAPSDFCFALKHPQIQKKTSKYIRYFCAESKTALEQWIMGIRTVKLGKQMLHNYEHLTHEISLWDLRPKEVEGVASPDQTVMLNHADLNDSRMSVPENSSRHSVIQVHNPSLVRGSSGEGHREVMSIEVMAVPPRKSSDSGVVAADGKSLSGSVSSSVSSSTSESGHKTPVKRVSFSATHSIINGDSSEQQVVKHRDSIISASTDSSEDSNSSGENRPGSSLRGKMRPKLPLTTETTRQLADMCNVSVDETPEAIYAETPHATRSSSSAFSRTDKRRASMQERRGSGTGLSGLEQNSRLSQSHRGSPLSPHLKQHSLDGTYQAITKHGSAGAASSSSSAGSHHYQQHVRRKSEPSVSAYMLGGMADTNSTAHDPLYDSNPLYSTVYASTPKPDSAATAGGIRDSGIDQGQGQPLEPIYNQIRTPSSKKSQMSTAATGSSNVNSTILPPPQFRGTGVVNDDDDGDDTNSLPPPLPPSIGEQTFPPPPPTHQNHYQQHESSPPLPPPPPQNLSSQQPHPSSSSISSSSSNRVKTMQVPPPPPPTSQPSSLPLVSNRNERGGQRSRSQSPSCSGNQNTLTKSNVAMLSQNHTAKSSPPPTLPKPQNNNSSSNSNSQPSTPPVQQQQQQPPLLPTSSSAAPKHPPPPPPLRLVSNESTCSSTSGSPLHVPIPPPMAPITPKLPPPPTLPKTTPPPSSAYAALKNAHQQITSNNANSSNAANNASNIKNPSSSTTQTKPKVGGKSPSSTSSSSCLPGQTSGEDSHNSCHQSTSLPFLSELAKQPKKNLESGYSSKDNKNSINSNERKNINGPLPHCPLSSSSSIPPSPSSPSSSSPSSTTVHQHRRSASAGSGGGNDKRAPPPPPPKRSENTRLSTSMTRDNPSTPSTPTPQSPSVSDQSSPCPILNGSSSSSSITTPSSAVVIQDPIYENYDGMMDINDLPPPPPELLSGLSNSQPNPNDSDLSRTAGSGKKVKPPPPLPKRSKETQLSSQ